MARQDASLAAIRAELIELLEAAACRITAKAEREGRAILRKPGFVPTQWSIFAYVLDALKSELTLHAVPQGDPPGSHGIGYEMRNVAGAGLYIKLKIEDEEAWVISFHR